MNKGETRDKVIRRDAKSCVSTVNKYAPTENKCVFTGIEPDPSFLFKNKYRVESTRLKNWDYSSNGWYYVTICEKNRENVFGIVTDGKIVLSEIGKIARQCWCEIPDHFPFVKLDKFVIMPNHIHGIIIIDKTVVQTQNLASVRSQNLASVRSQNLASVRSQNLASVRSQNLASVRSQNLASLRDKSSQFGPQSKNLASIIRGFKIGVTKYARDNDIPFIWQPRYYDHIIRDNDDLFRIQEYIINNPLNWDSDENNITI